jgi:hypothetical protein
MKTQLRFSVLASFFLLSLGFTLAPACAQTTRFVSTTGTNTNPASATSWATSTTNLQGAINASAANDQVWVAGGIYKPTSTTDRTASFAMKNGVAIYGGFVGPTPSNPTGETALSQRPSINPVSGQPSSSTLSGDLMGNDTPGFGNRSDNSYRVINNSSVNAGTPDRTSVLDGFVITGGNALQYGGAIYNDNSSPIIRNCSVLGNQGLYLGVVINSGGSPAFINCSLQNNQCFYESGAIYNSGSNAVLTNCSLTNNYGEYTGAIYNIASSPVLTNCSLLSNTATSSRGGAIYNNTSSHPVLINSILWDNGGENTFYNLDRDGVNTITIRYSLFDNTVTGYISDPTNLTTTTSPFVSSSSVVLAPGSLAIDAGLNSAPGLVGITTDLVGNPRIMGCRVDMGAVEFVNTTDGLPTVFITLPNGSTVSVAGNLPTLTLPPNGPLVLQASGGSTYERVIILERLNGYEIRQVDQNTTGIFPISRPGLFTLTVTGSNGCSRTVQGVVQGQ